MKKTAFFVTAFFFVGFSFTFLLSMGSKDSSYGNSATGKITSGGNDNQWYEEEEKLFEKKVSEAKKLYEAGTKESLEKAKSLLDEVLDKRPANTEAYDLRVKVMVAKSRIRGEEVSFEMKLDELKAKVKNSPELAIKMIPQMIKDYPDFSDEAQKLLSEAKVNLARPLAVNKGHLEDGEKLLREALADYPGNRDAEKLLSEVMSYEKKAEPCPFKIGSVYALTAFTLNGEVVPKEKWLPNHKLNFVSKSTILETSFDHRVYEYGYYTDTANRRIVFFNPNPPNTLYINVTYSSDLKTITCDEVDSDGKPNGYSNVFTLQGE